MIRASSPAANRGSRSWSGGSFSPGHIGVVGVFVPTDPEAATEQFDSRAGGWTKVLLHPAA